MRAAEAGSYLDRSSGSSVITGPQRWERKAGGSVRGDVTTQQCLGDSAQLGLQMEEGPTGHGWQVPLGTGVGNKTDSSWSLQKESVLPTSRL